MDPLAENYPSWSPYNYVGNSPLNAIDPDGRDWYRDNEGAIRFNPDLKTDNANSILKEGETYLWAEHSERKGRIRYKSDGAVFFANEQDAFAYMTAINDKERFGVFLKTGVLVLPDYKNSDSDAKIYEYNYTIEENKISNKDAGWEAEVLGSIHTHPKEQFAIPSGVVEGLYYGDRRAFETYFPQSLHLVLGLKNNSQMYASVWYAQEYGAFYSVKLPESINKPYNGDVFYIPLKNYHSIIENIIPKLKSNK